MKHDFAFAIGDAVEITASGERGVVIGLGTYAKAEDCALVYYKAADGRAVEGWWGVSCLRIATPRDGVTAAA